MSESTGRSDVGGEMATSAPALPEAHDSRDAPTGYERLAPQTVALWRLSAVFEVLFYLASAGALLLVVDLPVLEWPLLIPIVGLGGWYVIAIPGRRYRSWGYQLRSSDVRIRRGIWWRTVSVVPHVRMQHVDTRQGPLERHFDLATLVLYTAGSVGASVEIPGLPSARARALREHLAAVTGVDDAV